ncbi:MAG: type IV secretion system DNA-binding domain-containing protein [Clostridia bacterium]|nr:type IV secretion system DNA-binding domain-containing protein [Clostridia bacterium]
MITGNTTVRVIEGNRLNDTVPEAAKQRQQPTPSNPRPINILFNGKNGKGMPDQFVLTERLLSQHLMLIGGIGSGKTNTFNQIMQNIAPQLSARDVMIIFDTKGDFLKEFYAPGDIVISNDTTARGANGPDYWNILAELEDDDSLEVNCVEIATALFADKLSEGGDSFFPNAAKDLLTAVLYHFVKNRAQIRSSNKTLSECLKGVNHEWFLALLNKYPQFKAMKSYIPQDAPGQAIGVLAELQQVVRQVFIGNFAKEGTLSVRNLVRRKGGKKIFIEYDIGIGGMLTPIYSLMFDLAIKEALCRSKSDGNVFFVVDEFKLLPNLKHIDDAVNFGRSLGIKFMIGIQNVDQIIKAYDEHMALNIFSGFLNQFAFKVSDHSTREYIKERAGMNRKLTMYKTVTVQESIEGANVIEDWDVGNLKLGQAVVMLNSAEPFVFGFPEFIGRS